MPDDPSRQGKDPPSDTPERPCLARGWKKIPLEPDEEVVRHHPNPEEDGVGMKIPGGQISDPHVILQPLEEVLELSSLLMPFENPGGAPLRPEVGGDDPIPPGDQIRGQRR